MRLISRKFTCGPFLYEEDRVPHVFVLMLLSPPPANLSLFFRSLPLAVLPTSKRNFPTEVTF